MQAPTFGISFDRKGDYRAGAEVRDNLSDSAWLDRTWVGAILVERKMSAGALVIVDVRAEDAAQMALVEDHDVIQTLAANRTYDTFDVSVLPGQAWCRHDFRDSHHIDSVAELGPYDASRSRSK
jgi:hypothetical protein